MSTNSSSGRAWRNIQAALIVAGIQVCGAVLLTVARKQGLIDGESAQRGVMVLVGLGLAAYGNRMPKMLEGPPPQSLAVAALRQAIHRVGGWAMMLGGTAFATLWAFAPHDVAKVGSLVAVGAGVAVMLGYGAWRAVSYDRSSKRASLRTPLK